MFGAFNSHGEVKRVAHLAGSATEKNCLLFDSVVRGVKHNRLLFLVNHRLSRHPMIAIDQLFELCGRMPANKAKVRVGMVPENTDFDRLLDLFNFGIPLKKSLSTSWSGKP